MKKCQECGKSLIPGTKAKKFCSDDCRKRVKYKKDRAWVVANREKVAAYARAWNAANKEAKQLAGRKAYRKKIMAQYKEDKSQ